MIGKIAMLAALGYIGFTAIAPRTRGDGRPAAPGDLRLAGGPLSEAATLQSSPDAPPRPA